MKKIPPSLTSHLLAAAAFAFSGHAVAWSPGFVPAGGRVQSYDFSVNNSDRNDVVAFWHGVYQNSEGYETRIQWTGNYTGNNGSVAPTFVDDVERRVNYFRAMCGLDSLTQVNTSSTVLMEISDLYQPNISTQKVTAAQNAALMLERNYNYKTGQNPALSHSPAKNLVGWSDSAWNAAAHGNFAFGFYGPGAITEYVVEQFPQSTSTSNTLVGHRRWVLNPSATTFATGDQPGKSAFVPPTNVLYVGQRPAEEQTRNRDSFISYPSAGFFPAAINPPNWSVSCANADFSQATVTMTDASGTPIPVTDVTPNNSYVDPALIWRPASQATRQAVYEDATYQVQVANVSGVAGVTGYNYSVTLINPDRLTSSQIIAGPASLAAGGSAGFTFSPPAGTEASQVIASRKNSTLWKEDAETPVKSKVIAGTGTSYPLIAKTSSFPGFGNLSGASAFHLTFPISYDVIKRGVPEQTFELDRDIIANANAKLNFQFRRGFMTLSSMLVVESSKDGGVSWTPLGASIKGISDTTYDLSVSTTNRLLPQSAAPVRIRFRYFTTGGSVYTQEAAPTSPTGIFLDEITTTNCDWLESKKVTTLSARTTKFVFKSSSVGTPLVKGSQWQLRLRTQLGGKWFPPGPAKTVTITP